MFLSCKRFAAVGVLSVFCVMPVYAQVRSSAAKGINVLSAPVPTPLLDGKRAFISYELGDVTAFPTAYSGGPERAYEEFFGQMKAWGRFELVMDPSDADVVFAIRFVDSPGLSLPQIRVGISDAKTHVALWGFVEQVDPAWFKKAPRCQLLGIDPVAGLGRAGATHAGRNTAGCERLREDAPFRRGTIRFVAAKCGAGARVGANAERGKGPGLKASPTLHFFPGTEAPGSLRGFSHPIRLSWEFA